MKKAVAIILILAVTAQLLNELLVVAAFELQEAYIAQELCEEREVPDSDCHGHCQLTKKLTQDNDTNDRARTPRFEEIPNFSIYLPAHSQYDYTMKWSGKQLPAGDAHLPDELFTDDIFHPPS